jgi:hypothetical protein
VALRRFKRTSCLAKIWNGVALVIEIQNEPRRAICNFAVHPFAQQSPTNCPPIAQRITRRTPAEGQTAYHETKRFDNPPIIVCSKSRKRNHQNMHDDSTGDAHGATCKSNPRSVIKASSSRNHKELGKSFLTPPCSPPDQIVAMSCAS